jgi:N-methylhydantoinase B/oxoprolinase/acetone carboxylase alpha subunit
MPVDKELLERIAIEPPTDLEVEYKDKISVTDFAIFSTKLELMCDEIRQNMINTGLSPGIQGGDVCVGLYSASGDMAFASVGTLIHVCTGMIPCKYLVKYFMDDPGVLVEDGDVFFCNDINYGGFHYPDQLLIAPVFWEGRLIAWTVAASHEPETGGALPGGIIPTAKSRYEEGIKVPPVKLVSKFQFRTDVMDFLANMIRNPWIVMSDTKIKAGCCLQLREKILESVREKGVGLFAGVVRRLIEGAYGAAAGRIKMMNDGTYRHSVFFDLRGTTEEGLGVVHIALHKKGEKIVVDLSGSSPPTMSFFNTKPHVIRALLFSQVMHQLLADFPPSTAMLPCFEFKAPEDTVVNCNPDSATSGAMRVAGAVVNGIMVCLAKMIYSSEFRPRVTSGPGYAVMSSPWGMTTDQYGERCFLANMNWQNIGGAPVTTIRDGVDGAMFWFNPYADSLDIEHDEVQNPVLCLFRRMAIDQGGAGKFRGGIGAHRCDLLHNSKGPTTMNLQATTSRFPINYGIMGGYAGSLHPMVYIRETDWPPIFEDSGKEIADFTHLMKIEGITRLPSFMSPADPLLDGDGWISGNGSSGGFGDVLERDPEMVIKDLRRGLISDWAARNVYQVAFNSETLELDATGTEKLRAQKREERKKKGKPYAEFNKSWLKKRPSDYQLRYYGPWPDAIK